MHASLTLAREAWSGYDRDAIHHHLRKLSPQQVLDPARQVNARLVGGRGVAGLLHEPQVVALDTHEDPDWTKPQEDCIRARGHRGTSFVLDSKASKPRAKTG